MALGYFRYGHLATHEQMDAAKKEGRKPPTEFEPFAATVGKGTSRCGAGCTLGDLCAEWLAFLVQTVAVWFGWRRVFAGKTFAVWVLDFIFAYVFGIGFKYFAIAPMRGLGLWKELWAAIKADTLSLTAWQVGMYGFIAFANLYLFGHVLGTKLEVSSPEFWFIMQIAMLCGFVTAYPLNWWLIRAGLKEKM